MIKCCQCNKPILINNGLDINNDNAEPYTVIEHYQQPTTRLTEYYFHTKCFLEIAGNDYAPKEKYLDGVIGKIS